MDSLYFSRTESLISGYGNNDPGINLGVWYPNPQDKTHDLSIVAFYKLNKKWSFLPICLCNWYSYKLSYCKV